jgi:hypothetical protein
MDMRMLEELATHRQVEARVMLFDGKDESGVLRGNWDVLPWGYGDRCFCINLESGQSLKVWLECVTDTPATSGMRRGELLGLRWCDVDLDKRELRVVQTLIEVDHVPSGNQTEKPLSARVKRDVCR